MANPSASRPLSTLEATQGQISSQSSTDATLREVAFEWELTKGTIYLPLGCLQVDFLLLPLLDGPLFRRRAVWEPAIFYSIAFPQLFHTKQSGDRGTSLIKNAPNRRPSARPRRQGTRMRRMLLRRSPERWRRPTVLSHRMYLLISCRKFTPPQSRQLVVYFYKSKYEIDGFAGELTF
jgi:hypothetical protein